MTTPLHLPANHAQRFQLSNEVHGRSYVSLRAPERVSHLALIMSPADKLREIELLTAWCDRYVHLPPVAGAAHFNGEFGNFRLRWEQHSEFSSYTFYVRGEAADPFTETALQRVPAEWLQALPGQLIVAAHAALQPLTERTLSLTEIAKLFGGNTLVGSEVAGGAARAYTDFRIHADGFGRFLILDKQLGSRQAGRLVQRLFEIEVYRMMALLALPISKELLPWLGDSDRELCKITAAVAESRQADTELLHEITHLAAAVENSISNSQYRLDAAHVHYKLVGLRIDELREQRIQGLQTFREFMERRLEPAMNTCQAVEQRQRNLSERIAHASQLLRTRVEITIEMQNQQLLASMNRRAKLQLRLQETVEGLSVVVITYYFASLVGYMAKAGKSLGLHVNPDVVMGVTIPLTAIVVAVGVRYIRRVVERKSDL